MVTEAEVRARLERLVAHTTAPTLTAAEITALLEAAVLPDDTGRLASDDTEWVAAMALVVDDRVVPSSRTGKVYKVTISDGAAGAVEPVWPASGTVALDGVTYELATDTPYAWNPTYALAFAAAEGWRYKSGLVADRFRFADDGDTYDRNQIFEHCVRMAELYERKAAAGELVVGAPAGGKGASTITLDPTTRRVGLDEERRIVLREWDGTGEIPGVNTNVIP